MSAMEGALRRKEEVKRYYQRNAAGLPETGELFALLAEDEERHRLALSDLEQGGASRLDPSATLEKARFMLRRLSVADAASSGPPEELEVFYRAMDMEAACAEAYSRLAQESTGWQRELFTVIAQEEEMHFTILEHMRELLDPAQQERRVTER